MVSAPAVQVNFPVPPRYEGDVGPPGSGNLVGFSVDDFCTTNTALGNSTGLAALAAAVEASGGGVIDFTPGKEYLVGHQTFTGGRWIGQELFVVDGLTKGLIIRGNGARIKYASGLRFGTFDTVTGLPNSHTLPYYVETDIAFPSYGMLVIANCTGPVHVENLELHGNESGFTYGGPFGDTGWQLPGDGFSLRDNSGGQTFTNFQAHHFPRDGGQIFDAATADGDRALATFTNFSFDHNARQGVSIVGGRGYTFNNGKFNDTGRDVAHASAPTAGIDLEQETGIIHDITFNDCDFIGNMGPGLLTVGVVSGIRVNGGHMSGPSHTYSLSGATRIVLDGVKFTGSGTNGAPSTIAPFALKHIDCYWTDAPSEMPNRVTAASSSWWPDLGGGSQNVLFERCRWNMTTASYGLPYTYSDAIYRDCSFSNTGSGFSVTLGRFEGVNVATGSANFDGAIFVGRLTHNTTTAMEGSKTFDPGSLAAGASTSTTLTVASVEMTDMAHASFSLDLSGVTLDAYVSAPDVVTVYFTNRTGSTVDLASGTLLVKATSRAA